MFYLINLIDYKYCDFFILFLLILIINTMGFFKLNFILIILIANILIFSSYFLPLFSIIDFF